MKCQTLESSYMYLNAKISKLTTLDNLRMEQTMRN